MSFHHRTVAKQELEIPISLTTRIMLFIGMRRVYLVLDPFKCTHFIVFRPQDVKDNPVLGVMSFQWSKGAFNREPVKVVIEAGQAIVPKPVLSLVPKTVSE